MSDDQELPPGALQPLPSGLARRSVRSKVELWVGLVVVCVLAVIALALTTGWPAFTPITQVLAFLPLLTVFSAVLAVALFVIREWLLAAIATVLVITFGAYVAAAAAAPSWPQDEDEGVRVITANLHAGDATKALVARILADPPDLVFIQECTAECVAGVQAEAVRRQLPHQVVDPDPTPAGAALLSAWPMEEIDVSQSEFSMPAARVSLPVGDVVVRSAHPTPPVPGTIGQWRQELANLADFAAEHASGPVIIAGDFNATAYHRQFRDIASAGDLIEATGAFPGTWRSGWPGWLRTSIDHILLPADWRAVQSQVDPLEGSDHEMVSATLLPL